MAQGHRHLQHLLYRFLRGSRAETPREVCPLARRVMLPNNERNPYPPHYRVAFAFSHPFTQTAIGWPCGLLPRVEEQYGLTTFRKVDTNG